MLFWKNKKEETNFEEFSYKKFSTWVNEILKNPLPENVKGINFNLYEEEQPNTFGLQFVATSSFDLNDDDWACDEIFSSNENMYYFTNEKAVIRIDRGLTENDVPLFTGYNDVLLNYRQLKSIFDKQIADWKNRLDCCNCIYLIQDKNNGKQYVGSTYGKEGIWGRWREYAETGHGNDVQLMEKLKEDPLYAEKNFQWTILEVLPLQISDAVAIDRELLWKRKFCTHDFGYNTN